MTDSSKMKAEDWMRLRHFSIEEFDDPEIMEKELVFELDNFRHQLGTPMKITSSTRGEHLPNSQHYLGRAADVVFPSQPMHKLPDMFIAALRFKFTGIGIYKWGLHLDVREAFQRALWMCGSPGKYEPVLWRELTRVFLSV